jgi:hypothetical protein
MPQMCLKQKPYVTVFIFSKLLKTAALARFSSRYDYERCLNVTKVREKNKTKLEMFGWSVKREGKEWKTLQKC